MAIAPQAFVKPKLIEGQDYYRTPEGLIVFTAAYLLARGYCCGSGCRHCPYTDAQRDDARRRSRRSQLGL